MNAAAQTLQARITTLRGPLAIIGEHAQRYASRGVAALADGTLAIGHQPWRAPEAYAFRLFPPAVARWLTAFEERHSTRIPTGYRETLLTLNGCWAYGLVLYGLPLARQASPPLLDRSRVQPLDLGAANTVWKVEYRSEASEFHFGSRAWSPQENVGYFWAGDGIRSRRKTGEVVGHWADFGQLLEAELPEGEALMLERAPLDWQA